MTAPAPSISPDYLRSLSAVKQQKMVELDNILESGAKETCKESIKASLQALGLAVDEELLDNPEQLLKDSFFVQLIKFFPQYNKAGELENAIAADIGTGLCDYVSVESTNFSKVSKRLINTFFFNRLTDGQIHVDPDKFTHTNNCLHSHLFSGVVLFCC